MGLQDGEIEVGPTGLHKGIMTCPFTVKGTSGEIPRKSQEEGRSLEMLKMLKFLIFQVMRGFSQTLVRGFFSSCLCISLPFCLTSRPCLQKSKAKQK